METKADDFSTAARALGEWPLRMRVERSPDLLIRALNYLLSALWVLAFAVAGAALFF